MSELQARIERLQAALAAMCTENVPIPLVIMDGEATLAHCREIAGTMYAQQQEAHWTAILAALKAVTPEDCGPFAEVILG